MIFYLAYRLNKDNKDLYKKIGVVVLLPLVISSVWFLRNLILLGNPFWPFLNGIFHGTTRGTAFNTINFGPVFSFSTYFNSYLEFFGVPNGNISLISFYKGQFVEFLFVIWFISTLIFIFPLIKGFLQKNTKDHKKEYFLKSIYILLASFLFMVFLYIVNVGWFGSRLLLPAIPFMGILWAKGMNSIKINKVYLIIILVIGAGFIITESIKISIADKEWGVYAQDFEWARSNSIEEDIFYGNGQCLSYNINRLVVPHTAPLDFNEVDYIWVNNKWRIDFHMNEKSLNTVKNSDKLIIVYNNTSSGTTIYKVE